LPFLAGRIQSCIEHEREFTSNGGTKLGPSRSILDVLRTNIYLDAVIYSKPGLKAAVEASNADRVMFGTDHPFFPPLAKESGNKWPSVKTNSAAIQGASGEDEEIAKGILGGNAIKVLHIEC
jgi:predicted TIM-barrel fold metal-dependent hydrolase